MPAGRYEGLIPGEPVEVTADRGIRRISDDILSGSALTQIQGFQERGPVKLGQIDRGGLRGCAHERRPGSSGSATKGVIAEGMDADLVVLGRGPALRAVVLAGEVARP